MSILVAERGLRNTRTNRRWLAIMQLLADAGLSQEQAEATAWRVLRAVTETK